MGIGDGWVFGAPNDSDECNYIQSPCFIGQTMYAVVKCDDVLKCVYNDLRTNSAGFYCPYDEKCGYECDIDIYRVVKVFVESIHFYKDTVEICFDNIKPVTSSEVGRTIFYNETDANDMASKLNSGDNL